MKNKLLDLNNHLFEQLERLNDDNLKGDDLDREIRRTDSMVKVSQSIIETANVSLQAAKLMAEYGDDYRKMLPEAPAGGEAHKDKPQKLARAK
jgi:hypothetical protein